MSTQRVVDHSVLSTNQAGIILLLILSYIFNAPLVAGVVGLLMLGGALIGQAALGWIYTLLLRPAGLVKPNPLADNPEPHRFAQGFGGTVVLVGFAALVSGLPVVGWALAWLVVALAALNLFGGFCVGCAVYYWLNRLRVPGFHKAPPVGTFPGLRPRRHNG